MSREALVSYRTAGERRPRVGLLRDGILYAPPELDHLTGVIDLLQVWTWAEDFVRSQPPGPVVTQWQPSLLLEYPRKILCSGPNYTDHLREMGEQVTDSWRPYFFFKPPTTALTPDGSPVLIRGEPDERADWEGELGAVIGRGGRDIPVADALGHVAGYTVVNDISLRGPHRRSSAPAPFVWDWVASKGQDTTLPIAATLVPHWLVPDPQDLLIETRVNDTLHQSASTALMVCGVAELVAAASELVTLEPGDLIATGTPAGVGAGKNQFLNIGDKVEVTIAGIGSVCNTVRPRKENTDG